MDANEFRYLVERSEAAGCSVILPVEDAKALLAVLVAAPPAKKARAKKSTGCVNCMRPLSAHTIEQITDCSNARS